MTEPAAPRRPRQSPRACNVSRETSQKLESPGRRAPALADDQEPRRAGAPSPRSGPAISPTSLQLLRLDAAGASMGSTSAPAPAFPAWCSPSPAPRAAGCAVHLVESNARKCAFLRHVARLDRRAGDDPRGQDRRRGVRGFAGRSSRLRPGPWRRLPSSLAWSAPLLKTGTVGPVSRRGARSQAELTEAGEILEIRRGAAPEPDRFRRPGSSASRSFASAYDDLTADDPTDFGRCGPAAKPRVLGARQPEGRRRQDHHRDQSRHGARRDRREGADHRSRPAGQCLDRPRHRPQEPPVSTYRRADRRAPT